MTFKLKALATGVMGLGLVAVGPGAFAQTIGNSDCDTAGNDGVVVGSETCPDPSPTRAEGVLWTAAEQAVSIIAGIADSRGCFSASGATPISIEVDAAFGPSLHFAGNTTLGGYSYSTAERANGDDARVYVTADVAAGSVLGAEVSGLDGEFVTDDAFAIFYGNADWEHGFASLDEHIIKDFYAGVAVPAEVTCDSPGVEATQELINDGTCTVVNLNDASAEFPLRPVRIVRDNGLEVTTKKDTVTDLLADPTVDFQVGAPKGKWRQTSFYREPDGPGEGRLIYTKVRIAPFGAPVCALQLDCTVDETVDNPTCAGAITVFPLGTVGS